MNNKMMVLFVKNTGHVVAAATRATDPEGKASAAALAGTGLPVRSSRKIAPTLAEEKALVIPPDSLDVAVVQLDPDVFGSPLSFVAGGGVVAKLGSSIAVVDLFKTDKVTIEASSPPSDNLGVWVQLEEVSPTPGNAPERRVMEGVIDKGTNGTNKSVTLDLTIRPGGPPASIPNNTKEYYILVLVAGHQPLFSQKSPS